MKNHTKDFKSFSTNESWNTVNMGGRSINVIGMPPSGMSGRGPKRTFYAVMLDGDVEDVFTSELEATDLAMDMAERLYGRAAMETAREMGIDPEDVEGYEEVLFEIAEDDGRVFIEEVTPRGLLQIVGSDEDLMELLSGSSLDQQQRDAIYSEAIGR